MGRELVKVLRVDSCQTANPSVTSHCVNGETVEAEPRFVQFQTVNDWLASICSIAKQRGTYVWIGWRETPRWGRSIVTADPDTSKFVHDEAS